MHGEGKDKDEQSEGKELDDLCKSGTHDHADVPAVETGFYVPPVEGVYVMRDALARVRLPSFRAFQYQTPRATTDPSLEESLP